MTSSIVLRASTRTANSSRKGVLFVCVLMGIILVGLGSQSLISVAGNRPDQILQTATASTGKMVVIVAPAGSGLGQTNFLPANFVLVIGVNNTFVLKNEDTADHTMTSRPGDPMAFDTGDISGLSSSSPITLTIPGTYNYYCQFHPASMRGTITVIEPAT